MLSNEELTLLCIGGLESGGLLATSAHMNRFHEFVNYNI